MRKYENSLGKYARVYEIVEAEQIYVQNMPIKKTGSFILVLKLFLTRVSHFVCGNRYAAIGLLLVYAG